MKISNPFSKIKLLILAPVILVMILDLIFTLVGQPEIYWQNYNFFNEGSPLGQILMFHPASFVIFFVFYILFVIILVGNLSRPWDIMAALSFYLGHIWGSSSWLDTIFYKLTAIAITGNIYWFLNVGYFIIIAIITGFFINKYLKITKI